MEDIQVDIGYSMPETPKCSELGLGGGCAYSLQNNINFCSKTSTQTRRC